MSEKGTLRHMDNTVHYIKERRKGKERKKEQFTRASKAYKNIYIPSLSSLEKYIHDEKAQEYIYMHLENCEKPTATWD